MDRILVIEDDEVLATGINYTLKKEGFKVIVENNLKNGENTFNSEEFNLILLDVMLPDGNGFDLCRKIRKTSQIPIIFLTACDEEVNVVQGLDIGADDYITKPFRVRELVSRIRAALRRSEFKEKSIKNDNIINCGDIVLDLLERKLIKNNEEIKLTSTEHRLMNIFVNNTGKILSRNIILEKLWDLNEELIDSNTLSVYIRRLREKIEDNPSQPQYILTIRGLGYRWDKECK